ncbi:ATP-binding protein [Pandoraea fibrosis]|uniref:Virulence sensor protein BvgS n=1 Tax=Pandoraea fibrosis TaxID=1891094 RepID=A0A5E4YX94_9BURK|nr:ATP-binding protein [Pandoraea fibrosis]VVE53132.1 capsular synthesis two-component sensor kinase and response regulator transcription protein [Pandoraea fibrosis]
MPKSPLRKVLRYNKSVLLTCLGILSFVILAASVLIALRGVRDAEEDRIAEFVERRERLELVADQVSSRLMQLVDLYEGLWTFHEGESVPSERYRRALLLQQGVVQSADDLTAVPFTIASNLVGTADSDRLSLYLRLVRAVSAAPSIDAQRLAGIRLTAVLYAPDGAFAAASPSYSDAALRAMRLCKPRDVVARLIDGVEAAYAVAKAGKRPLWIAAPGNDAGATATIVIPIIKDGERVAMLAVNVPSVQFVQYFRNLENLPGFHVLSENGYPLHYGVETDEERRVFGVVSAERQRIVNHDSKILTFWRAGTLVISQRVKGPEWIAVYAIPLSAFLAGISPLYWASAALTLLALSLLWLLYFFYRRWVATPMESEVARASELEAFRRSVLQTLPVGVVVFSTGSRRVLYVNTLACELLGTASLTRIKQFCDDVLTQSGYCGEVEAKALMECSWAQDGSEEVALGVSIGASRFDGNDVVLIGMLDLSDRKEKEALLQAAKLAAEAENRAKSLFVAAISHEIRTPLHGAMGNLELLAAQDIPPEHLQRVAVIRSAFDGLLTLVNDILDATKIESGAMRICAREAVVSQSVTRAIQNFAPAILAKGLTLSYAADEALDHPLSVDDLRLGQILQNLLGNAVKFTTRGGISVRSRWETAQANGGTLVIDVQDTGIGISSDVQRRLFQALDQGDDGIERRFGGTGLGLYLCRQLASLMGGTVDVDSDLGTGARFRLRIPATKVDAALDAWPSLAGMKVAIRRTGAAANAALVTWMEAIGVTVCEDGAAHVDLTIALFDVCDRDARLLDASQSNNTACLLRLTPDGPLLPTHDDVSMHLTSLDWLALRRFLHEHHSGLRHSEATEALGIEAVEGGAVIVADDDEVSRTLLCEQLRMLGVSDVRAYGDGERAVAAHRSRPAALLFVDLNMPKLDGRGVVRRLRAMKDGVKVVVVTAGGDAEIDGFPSYFDDSLQKPVTLSQVSRALVQHLVPDAGDAPATRHAEKGLPDATIADPVLLRMQRAFVNSWSEDRPHLTISVERKDVTTLRRLLHRVGGALSALGEDAMVSEVNMLQVRASKGWSPDMASSVTALLARLDGLVRTYATEYVASNDTTR